MKIKFLENELIKEIIESDMKKMEIIEGKVINEEYFEDLERTVSEIQVTTIAGCKVLRFEKEPGKDHKCICNQSSATVVYYYNDNNDIINISKIYPDGRKTITKYNNFGIEKIVYKDKDNVVTRLISVDKRNKQEIKIDYMSLAKDISLLYTYSGYKLIKIIDSKTNDILLDYKNGRYIDYADELSLQISDDDNFVILGTDDTEIISERSDNIITINNRKNNIDIIFNKKNNSIKVESDKEIKIFYLPFVFENGSMISAETYSKQDQDKVELIDIKIFSYKNGSYNKIYEMNIKNGDRELRRIYKSDSNIVENIVKISNDNRVDIVKTTDNIGHYKISKRISEGDKIRKVDIKQNKVYTTILNNEANIFKLGEILASDHTLSIIKHLNVE